LDIKLIFWLLQGLALQYAYAILHFTPNIHFSVTDYKYPNMLHVMFGIDFGAFDACNLDPF